MRRFSDFSEFKAAVGTEIGASEWVEITQDRINRLPRLPAMNNGSMSTTTGRKMSCQVARPSPTVSCPSAWRRCSFAP
jgi:hypothetical protein